MVSTVSSESSCNCSPTTIDDLPCDVLMSALRLLDGRSLAFAGCSSSHLRALAGDAAAWRSLCLSSWPSLDHPRLRVLSPRRLFADAFPFPSTASPSPQPPPLPLELISAVDLHHGADLLLSRIIETPTFSPWFLSAPFRVDAVSRPVCAPRRAPPAELTLSWIIINPATGRSINVSSRRPVATGVHWYTGETYALFAIIIGAQAISAAVTVCDERDHSISSVSLMAESIDGTAVSGRSALEVIAALMETRRGGAGEEGEVAARRRYEDWVGMKWKRKETAARWQATADLWCSAAAAAVILTLLLTVALR